MERRESCSGKRLNDKLNKIKERIILVLILVFSICSFLDSEELILIAILKEFVMGTC